MMKTLITTTAAALLTAAAFSAGATDVYQGLGEGNPDLVSQPEPIDTIAVQPGVGSALDRYHGWAEGNDDLFDVRIQGSAPSGAAPEIYSGASGNPDLSY